MHDVKKIDNNKGEANIITNNFYNDPRYKIEFDRLVGELEDKELHIVGLTDILELQAKMLQTLVPEYQNIIYDVKSKEFIRREDKNKLQLNLFEDE